MSALGQLVPVIFLLIFVGIFAWIGFQVYLYTQGLAERGQQSMAKRNISFTADGGMRVGVKELKSEDYADKTQNFLVKAWNLSSWPAYKSMFWNQDAQAGIREKQKAARPQTSRHSSTTSAVGTGSASGADAKSRPQSARSPSQR